MEGSYALVSYARTARIRFWQRCKESPLILGVGNGENFLASDVSAILSHTREVYYLDDDEIAVLTPNDIKIYTSELEESNKAMSHVDWDISAAEKRRLESIS